MAFSHIGRLLRERAQAERIRTAENLIGGSAKEFAQYHWFVGYAAGIEWVLAELETIEKEN